MYSVVHSVGREGTSSIVIGNTKLQEFLSDDFYFLWEVGGILIC